MGRGLRQGDPISPFLFIIAVDCIERLLKRALDKGLYDAMLVGSNEIKVSHLQFADDIIFLGKTSIKNAILLRRFLLMLELVSIFRVNKEKCQVISIQAEQGIMHDIAEILGCRSESLPFNYLGLRVGCSHKKATDWKYIVDKVRSRLGKWSNLNICFGGRITLVRSVLSALPTYALSVFKAPAVVIKKLISLQQQFLWGGKENSRKMVWAKWASLAPPKRYGGLGVRDLLCFNKALMGKWAWRAVIGKEELWLEIVRSNIGRRCSNSVGLHHSIALSKDVHTNIPIANALQDKSSSLKLLKEFVASKWKSKRKEPQWIHEVAEGGGRTKRDVEVKVGESPRCGHYFSYLPP